MSLRKLSVLIAFVSAGLFSLLQLVPAFRLGDNRIYDIFLRIKPRQALVDNVVFLNVDDSAIAKIGVHPWPRSVIANGLLRLKEHGAKTAIFDIEYIDKSPTQVDEAYLRGGLANDYDRHFSEIGKTVADILNAVASGKMPPEYAASLIDDVNEIIADEANSLYANTLRIASDDDLMLAQAAALFGRTWGTLNLQESPLSGEQAQRRLIAEERFSYPVNNAGGITEGTIVDILPANVLFTRAVQGAGFTNISPDPDGTRRRIYLTQEVQGHWYLQLAFAPLMHSWGNPDITVEPYRFTIDNGEKKITIPLDKDGAMLLDWPHENYNDSYDHISFEDFYLLDEYLAHIEEYLQLLQYANRSFFPYVVQKTPALLRYFPLQREAKRRALEECSDEAFDEYISCRDRMLEQAAAFVEELYAENYIENESRKFIDWVAQDDPEMAAGIAEEAEFCLSLLEYIDTEIKAFYDMNRRVHNKLTNRFCIIGRTDTGTTDIAVNPFHPKYINVGTHGVVLDVIQTQTFIRQLPVVFSILFTLVFVPLVLIPTSGLSPSTRSILGFAGVLLAVGLPLGLLVAAKVFVAPMSIVLAMAAAVILREVIAFVTSEREKRFIRQAFSTYLSPGVVAELIADPEKLNLGGEKREMTVIFTDLKGFSTISEDLDPSQLVRLLNKYLTVMSNIIMENQGTIDKYEGDAIIAFFGAPIYREDHAALACYSALAMKEAEAELNGEVMKEGLSPMPLYTRIGINTGEMVVGNMGTYNKMDYTVMGNSVNLAARLEGINKQYGTGIIMSEFTKEQAGGAFTSRQLDKVRVVGIHKPVMIHELTGKAANASGAALQFTRDWKEAIACYEGRRFGEAAVLFKNIAHNNPDDSVIGKYIQRCETYAKDPPPDAWDGVVDFSEK